MKAWNQGSYKFMIRRLLKVTECAMAYVLVVGFIEQYALDDLFRGGLVSRCKLLTCMLAKEDVFVGICENCPQLRFKLTLQGTAMIDVNANDFSSLDPSQVELVFRSQHVKNQCCNRWVICVLIHALKELNLPVVFSRVSQTIRIRRERPVLGNYLFKAWNVVGRHGA